MSYRMWTLIIQWHRARCSSLIRPTLVTSLSGIIPTSCRPRCLLYSMRLLMPGSPYCQARFPAIILTTYLVTRPTSLGSPV
uniref:Hypothetical secreted protein 87 n=1 Tax=Amblyomma variegatum TaxID=34610 RepID=F0JA93_AMBVA|nr:TPA_inf: hypothetical secreted protein 87 [Amblyomma variegatum]